MSLPLLATRFFVPPPPPNDLPRQRLFDLLNPSLAAGRRLALICAPAGYGKTTLAAGWVRALKQGAAGLAAGEQAVTVSWLSLEESDNDPQQFLSYLIAGLRRVMDGGDDDLFPLLQAVPSAAPETLLAGLVNILAALPGSVLLVLDDYQVIHTQAVHGAVTFLCEHLPPNTHLLVTSRSDPPLPLHRYRARGQVVEIRVEALRLTRPEIDRLLAEERARSAAPLDLGPEEAGLLAERTEGWPVGIQMALLSLRGRPNPREFIRAWTGSQRFILDYLGEEVFQNQPPAVQRFLLRTAVLDRFCAPLCDALNAALPGDPGQEEAPGESPPAQEIIAGLERDNLFLVPLDEEAAGGSGAGWFRYHHLFLDLLRMRLKQARLKQAPDLAARLHRQAAAWLEANGWPREAIQHAIQAGDFTAAAGLVEQHTLRLFSEGELPALLSWIRLLPPELAATRPWLRIYQAWALAFAGDLPAARQLCQAVEDGLHGENDLPPDEQRRLRADMVGIRAMTALMSGQVSEVLALEQLPADTFPEGSLFARSAVDWALGYAWRMLGDLPKAITHFQAMQQASLQTGNNWTYLTAAVDLGLVLRLNGRLREAEALYRDGLRRVEQFQARGAGFVGRLESFLANVLYEKNELEEARSLALSSIRHNRYWDNPNHTTHAYLVLARICLGARDLPAASEALAEAEKTAALRTVVPPLHAALEALRVRLWLAENDLPAAARWLESRPPASGGPEGLRTEMGETLAIAEARARLALGDRQGAQSLLARLEETARAGSHHSALIEILTLTALSAPGGGAASGALREALSLGCPEGCARVFLDEGEAMRALLGETLAALRRERPARAPHSLAGCIQSLLDQFPTPPAERARPAASPLTERELDILRAIAEGLTNQEIGRRLYISPGTVKAHSAAIYRKLDVANRTEAIAKAKDMGLV